jgi:Icc-related predicted phosphoesterase
MKIVSFGDVHMATRNLQRMTGILRDTDLIVISGDLTNFGGSDDAAIVLDVVQGAVARVLALPGNLDKPEVIDYLEAQGVALHGHGLAIDGIGIFGCGGSNLTPFHTPLELSEEELYATLHRGYREMQARLPRTEQRAPVLMVCHTPPYATKCDRLANGAPVGSAVVRRFIEEMQPDVCISGHIHESAGTDRIGRTTVLNAGPFKGGGYIVVEGGGAGLNARLEFL